MKRRWTYSRNWSAPSESCYIIFGLQKSINIAVQVFRLFVYYSPEFNSYSIQRLTSMEGNIRNVRSYKKNPIITLPQTPDYLEQLLPSAPTSSLPPSPNDPRGPPSTTLGSPFNEPGWLDGSSSQPRLRQSPQTDRQRLAVKFDKKEVLRNSGFDSVGEFLEKSFYNPSCIAANLISEVPFMWGQFLGFSKDATRWRCPISFPSSTSKWPTPGSC